MAEANETTSTKKKTVYTPVTMNDGRTVQFPGEQKALTTLLRKDGTEAEAANEAHSVRFDFRNGEFDVTSVDDIMQWGLGERIMLHGATQKLRDVYAGTDSVDDAVEDFRELKLQLSKGVWSERRESAGPGGSILLRAMVEVSGKTAEEVREILSGMTPKEKQLLRQMDELRPVIQRLEAAKATPSDLQALRAKAGF